MKLFRLFLFSLQNSKPGQKLRMRMEVEHWGSEERENKV